MALYHLSSQIIGRSGGKSAVASSAYRAGEKIQDEHIGLTFDYTKKMGVDHQEILAPDPSPAWAHDRGQLWNQVEKIEKRKDSQLARELNIAIPKELTREQQIELVRNFAKEQFVAKGMIADVTMHHLNSENPHTHIMLTTREIGSEGFGKKNRDWNDRELLKDWRKEWAEQTNLALEKAGVLERVDHRSLKDQGSQQIPQIHVGVHASAMEKKGIQTERGDINRAIKELNKQLGKDQLQPKTFQTLKTDFYQARTELGRQEEVIMNLENQLHSETSKLGRYNDYDKRISEVEGRLGKLSRLNPMNWSEIKALEQNKVRMTEDKQTELGETKREHIEQRITQLNQIMQSGENKLPGLTASYDKAKDAYDERSIELKAVRRLKDLAKSKDLLDRYKAGDKLTIAEAKLINSFSKELKIKKLQITKTKEFQI